MAAPPKGRRIVKKKGGGHGHHGGAWKVAYADFVTAMMALFMVLWLVASSDASSRAEMANYFRTGILPEGDMSMGRASQFQPAIIEETGAPNQPDSKLDIESAARAAGKAKKKAQALREALKEAIEAVAQTSPELARLAAAVTVKITEDGILIEAADQDDGPSMLFDVSSPELQPALTEFLRRLGPTLASVDGAIEIHGHTDARAFPPGAKSNNWTLSFDRAEKARRVLEGAGMPAGRVDRVIAHASTQLLVPDQPLAARNRRLSLLVKPTAPMPVAPAPPAAPPRAPTP
jgi:chemotaxis protein MotB